MALNLVYRKLKYVGALMPNTKYYLVITVEIYSHMYCSSLGFVVAVLSFLFS